MSPAPTPKISIEILSPDMIEGLYGLTQACRHATEEAYFEQALAEQIQGKRLVFVGFAPDERRILGYVHYNRFPQYQPFRRFNIPESQDLFVHPDFRGQGIGAALLAACEDQARQDKCAEIGIGVGVIPQFGPAMRLYIKSGYVPDGAGLTCDRDPITPNEIRSIDEHLCLMMVKGL